MHAALTGRLTAATLHIEEREMRAMVAVELAMIVGQPLSVHGRGGRAGSPGQGSTRCRRRGRGRISMVPTIAQRAGGC